MNNDETIAAITEAGKIVVAMIQAGPGTFVRGGADTATVKIAEAYAAIYGQIQKSVDG